MNVSLSYKMLVSRMSQVNLEHWELLATLLFVPSFSYFPRAKNPPNVTATVLAETPPKSAKHTSCYPEHPREINQPSNITILRTNITRLFKNDPFHGLILHWCWSVAKNKVSYHLLSYPSSTFSTRSWCLNNSSLQIITSCHISFSPLAGVLRSMRTWMSCSITIQWLSLSLHSKLAGIFSSFLYLGL